MDALLATLQMPAGIPVATVTLGSAGPINAAVLAVQILATGRPALATMLKKYKQKLKKKVAAGNGRVKKAMEQG
jgi:phosphoribosylcarboxyaminoimidazole (NCAIR) mutase